MAVLGLGQEMDEINLEHLGHRKKQGSYERLLGPCPLKTQELIWKCSHPLKMGKCEHQQKINVSTLKHMKEIQIHELMILSRNEKRTHWFTLRAY